MSGRVELSIGELIGAGTLIAGTAAVWGALSWRLRLVEKGDTWRASARDQGVRLGDVEDRCAKLEGFMLGLKYKRKPTRPQGLPAGAGEDSDPV